MLGRVYISYTGLLLLALVAAGCAGSDVTREGTSPKKTITILPPDRDGPEVIIESPRTRGLEVVHRGESLVVKGQVYDRSGVARVTINGERAVIDEGNGFSVIVELEEGDNTITVQAFDRRDNLTTKTFSVERSGTALAPTCEMTPYRLTDPSGIRTKPPTWPTRKLWPSMKLNPETVPSASWTRIVAPVTSSTVPRNVGSAFIT